jgi:hypothetical protein
VVKDIAIYVEGGGDTVSTREPFRRGMSAFMKSVVSVVRQRCIRWRVVPCGPRGAAYAAFVDALANEPGVFNVLLIDSEDPVPITVAPWEHLNSRVGDKWDKPAGADDERCQMMVACMEAWFLADPDGLRRHFGGNFDSGKLPPPNQAETRTKADISDAMRKATSSTPAREYQKIRDGARLLEKVDSAEVRKHCKWCERLFRTLGNAIEAKV